jgi:hypothetical protein
MTVARPGVGPPPSAVPPCRELSPHVLAFAPGAGRAMGMAAGSGASNPNARKHAIVSRPRRHHKDRRSTDRPDRPWLQRFRATDRQRTSRATRSSRSLQWSFGAVTTRMGLGMRTPLTDPPIPPIRGWGRRRRLALLPGLAEAAAAVLREADPAANGRLIEGWRGYQPKQPRRPSLAAFVSPAPLPACCRAVTRAGVPRWRDRGRNRQGLPAPRPRVPCLPTVLAGRGSHAGRTATGSGAWAWGCPCAYSRPV